MTYCTSQNLIDRFGESELIQLTDRDNLGVIDAGVLAQAIADADAEINGYLAAYPLPLAIVPANLTRIACDIARYHLYDDQLVEPVAARYTSAIKYLEKIAAGKIQLGPDSTGTVDVKTGDDVTFQSADSVFGRGTY